MSEETLKKIINVLTIKKISFKHQEHEIINRSSEDASKVRGTNVSDAAKALILKTKTGKFIQLIIPADKKANLKIVKKLIGEKNISLASPDEVFALTECVVGSVPPFGILWNIPVYADNKLLEKKEVVFSAGTLKDSIFLNPKELLDCNNAILANISADKEN